LRPGFSQEVASRLELLDIDVVSGPMLLDEPLLGPIRKSAPLLIRKAALLPMTE